MSEKTRIMPEFSVDSSYPVSILRLLMDIFAP